MKYSSLIMLSSLLVSSAIGATEGNSWSVQSSEQQFDSKSAPVTHSYDGTLTNKLSLSPGTQSKNSTVGISNKEAQAKVLTVRPQVKSINQDFWIFDAWVEFFSDQDRDGYFNHFSVEFDADTAYDSADVYARLYLGQNEVFKEYHVTSNFEIYSDSSDDSFVVESELLNGFPPGEYEVLIELYDAYSDELVAVYDGNDDADLYLLSLESIEYETVEVVVIRDNGGSLGLWTLLLLPLLWIRRQRS